MSHFRDFINEVKIGATLNAVIQKTNVTLLVKSCRLFGCPMLYYRYAIYYRRANTYELKEYHPIRVN